MDRDFSKHDDFRSDLKRSFTIWMLKCSAS
jgi:hypothetical protein